MARSPVTPRKPVQAPGTGDTGNGPPVSETIPHFRPRDIMDMRSRTAYALNATGLSSLFPEFPFGVELPYRFQTSRLDMFLPWYVISVAVKTSTTKSGFSGVLKYCSNIGFQYFFLVATSP